MPAMRPPLNVFETLYKTRQIMNGSKSRFKTTNPSNDTMVTVVSTNNPAAEYKECLGYLRKILEP
jgi:hypothetical protein